MAKSVRNEEDTIVDIEGALRRAMIKADQAYHRTTLQGEPIAPEHRERIVSVSRLYIDIARALQVEREFEQSEIERIRNGNVPS